MIPAEDLDSSSFKVPIISSHDIIHQLNPTVIPRISDIANMSWCERAAYNISFFGVESDSYLDGAGEIGRAVHRIVIKSILEIVDLIKKGNDRLAKEDAMNVFLSNAREEVDLNWKCYALAGIEQPLPIIMQDLNIRADRLSCKIVAEFYDYAASKYHKNDYKKVLLRPEFTIRNKDIPLEGRLDLLKITLAEEAPPLQPTEYVPTDHLIDLKIEDIEIIQIKTGKAEPRSPAVYMQANAEALLLMQTLKLRSPPKYTWQFADRDVKHRRFNFAKVYEAVAKYIQLWKAEQSPNITGFCPNCPLKQPCRDWYFARSDKLSKEDLIRRSAVFRLSQNIRKEIADTDRWKVYVSFREPDQRHTDGWTITDLKVHVDSIDLVNQQLTLIGDAERSFGNFVDFGIGDYVTISDGDPNLGSNPTAIITEIDLRKSTVKIQSVRNDLYVLAYDNRQNYTLTMDRFDFDKGLTTIKYLDSFYRQSPYADVILERAVGTVGRFSDDNNNNRTIQEQWLSQQQQEEERQGRHYHYD